MQGTNRIFPRINPAPGKQQFLPFLFCQSQQGLITAKDNPIGTGAGFIPDACFGRLAIAAHQSALSREQRVRAMMILSENSSHRSFATSPGQRNRFAGIITCRFR